MAESTSALLDRALAAVRAHDLRAALVALLDAWKLDRAERLAALIDAVSPLAAASLRPPADAQAWTRAASQRDPVMRHWLAATLPDVPNRGQLLQRARRLVNDAPDDPRVATAVLDLIAIPRARIPRERSDSFWRSLFSLVAKLDDPRVLARARGLADGWTAQRLRNHEVWVLRTHLAEALADIEAIHAEAAELSGADLARADAIAVALAASPAARAAADEPALLSAIYATPADDGPRQIYADWLLERCDPRGEFIALQLADRNRDRQQALASAHAPQWLAAFGRDVSRRNARFARGFADVVHATEIDDGAAWSTVRVAVGAVPASDAWQLASLRVLRSIRSHQIRHLATLARPLPVVELDWGVPQDHGLLDGETVPAFGAIRVLPELRALVMRYGLPADTRPARAAWLWSAPWADALRELTFRIPLDALGAWLDELAPTRLARVALWGVTDANDQPMGGVDRGWCAELTRNTAGALSRLAVVGPANAPRDPERYGNEALRALASLRRGQLTSLHVTIPPAPSRTDGARVRDAIARLAEPLDLDAFQIEL